jgi:lipoprotein-anchoring transpeptidase ErfK/SrfK
MHIFVHVPSQTLDLIDGETVIRRYAISTSRFGIGTEAGSNKTPSGHFKVAEKHGDGAPPGEIFISRVATGRIGQETDDHDHVQTRILWLAGLDPENANTYDRYIYIHGTNAESRLGTPASFGCVRMANDDVIDLYDRVPVGTAVEIAA